MHARTHTLHLDSEAADEGESQTREGPNPSVFASEGATCEGPNKRKSVNVFAMVADMFTLAMRVEPCSGSLKLRPVEALPSTNVPNKDGNTIQQQVVSDCCSFYVDSPCCPAAADTVSDSNLLLSSLSTRPTSSLP